MPFDFQNYAGRNFAPKRELDELTKRKRSQSPSKLAVALMNKRSDYMDRDDQAWREQYNVGQMVAQKRLGKLQLVRNPFTGMYMFVKRDGRFEDRKALGGLVQFYSTKLLAGWLSSRPEIDPICTSDNDQIEEYIDDVKIVQDHYQNKFYKTPYETDECLSAQDYGTWVTMYRFDPYEQDITCELLPFPACRWDMSKIAEDSGYFIYDSTCSNAELQQILQADIPSDDVSDNYGLNLIQQIAKMGGNVVGQGKDRPYGTNTPDENTNVITQMWLKPEEYCDIELEADEETLAGVDLPKGSLMEAFPNGMCAVGIQGMRRIIGLYAENHEDHIVSGRYHIQSLSGVGKGISDLIDTSKEMDDLYSQASAYVKMHGMPSWAFNSQVVTEDKVKQISQGRKAIALDFSQAPDGINNVNQVIQHLAPSNPGSSAFDLWEKLNDNMMMASQVTSFSNAFPGVDNTTATGAKIGDANAQMLLVPQLLNKASHRIRSCKVIFNLFKKYVDKPKFFANKTKNPITAGKYLTGTQFNDIEVDFDVVANSEAPINPMMQKEGLMQLYQFTGGLQGLIEASQVDPEMTSHAISLFVPGAKLPIPQKDDIARVCRKRVEQAKEILEVEMANQELMAALGMPADNSMLAQSVVSQLNPPVSPMEKWGAQKAEWYQELLDTDELQFAPPQLRLVVEELIRVQIGAELQGQAQLAQATAIAQMAAQAPVMQAQQEQAMQQQQAAEQQAMAQNQAQGQQQLALKAAEMAMRDEEAELGMERDRMRADEDENRAIRSEARNHQRTLELERMRRQAA